MKKILFAVVVLTVLCGLVYWYANYRGWFDTFGPDNLPTAEDRQRMEEVERSSAQIAPDAKAGAGVFLKGTLPPKPVEPATGTTSASTSTSEGAVSPPTR